MPEPRRRGALRLLAYCLASGVLGTGVAAVAGLGASGTAQAVIWVSDVVAVAVIAGLAYGTGLLNPRRFRRLRRGAGRRGTGG